MLEKYDVFYDKENQCYQVRTKSNVFVIEFDDDLKYQVFEYIVNNNKSSKVIAKELLEKFEKSIVVDVFYNLNEFGLLSETESNFVKDVFGIQTSNKKDYEYCQVLSNHDILILGKGSLSNKIKEVLTALSLEVVNEINIDSVENDYDMIENIVANYDFFVFDSSCWNPSILEKFNIIALKHNKSWLYIGGLEGHLYKIGPIFSGKETGCYNCLIKRIKSNHDYVSYLNSYENYLKSEGKSSKPDSMIYKDIYEGIIARIVALEISKFIQFWTTPKVWKSFVSFNVLDYTVKTHDLLKIPHCEICKPIVKFNPAPWLEPISLNQNLSNK